MNFTKDPVIISEQQANNLKNRWVENDNQKNEPMHVRVSWKKQ